MLPKSVANIILVLVAIVWVANFFAPFFVPGYKPDPSINGIFGTIMGAALALTKRDQPDSDAAGRDGAHHE